MHYIILLFFGSYTRAFRAKRGGTPRLLIESKRTRNKRYLNLPGINGGHRVMFCELSFRSRFICTCVYAFCRSHRQRVFITVRATARRGQVVNDAILKYSSAHARVSKPIHIHVRIHPYCTQIPLYTCHPLLPAPPGVSTCTLPPPL